jgi:regulator of sigma E protease
MLYFLLPIVFLNIIYLVSLLIFSIGLKITERHYFLGFNPCLFSFQLKGTKFSIGIYIPIVGLARVYQVENGEKKPAKYPWEFFEHSLAMRFLVTIGGPVVLLVSGLLIFIGLSYFVGESIISKEEVNRHGIYTSDWAKELGFQRGDRILSINGKDYEEFFELIAPSNTKVGNYYTVSRGGKEINIYIKETDKLLDNNQMFVSLLAPFEIQTVLQGYPAEKAGIISGDKITKVNGNPIVKYSEMNLEFAKDEDGIIELEICRKERGSLNIFNTVVTLGKDRKLGIFPKAIYKGTHSVFSNLSTNIRAFAMIVSGTLSSSKAVSSPMRIANTKGIGFWHNTALYAIWFAFWNLLPLPKSTFWEMIALGYEGIAKKKYPNSIFKKSLVIAWIPVVAYMVFSFTNDLSKLF